MYLKNQWNKIGIKKKLFIITSSVVLITSIVIYTLLFLIVPIIYLDIKENTVKTSTNQLIETLENNTNIDYTKTLDQYAYNNEGMVLITTLYGDVVYSSNRIFGKPPKEDITKRNFFKDDMNEKKDIKISKEFYFKGIDRDCIITIHSPIKFLNNMQMVMIRILPIIILITIGIGLLSQYIYSIVISKPLFKINNVAKKISKLNFNEKLSYTGKDEIAELSNSINLISSNLEEKIYNLKIANEKLLSDIEKEKLQDRRRRDFIKAISHELKTPITVINGQIEGMIYKIGPYKDRDKYLKESLDSVLELKTLVLEIINLAKYEEDLYLKYEEFSLNNLVKDIVDGYEYFILEKNLKVNIKEEEVLLVNGDINIIKKIISNLINNSLKYSLENKDIEIYINKNGLFEITNYSKDVNNISKDSLFKAFYRGEKSRNKETGGSGLGLYIVKTLLDTHGNIEYKINIDDEKFIFSLYFKKE
ncbi:ATP-binding protein [Eubacterium multiforme]|uniref:histidine kinase n=1 Tax=Eubacterium multiforme TaxID=83339 RepID=A0ABT9UQI3_9FIRM|nr:HAMP domain-containing sensor histidine kinase [Eubacterium multiforme]MDQ0148562.1 two-component system sensor histidine kinase VanS [Eubacterium multiforme]